MGLFDIFKKKKGQTEHQALELTRRSAPVRKENESTLSQTAAHSKEEIKKAIEEKDATEMVKNLPPAKTCKGVRTVYGHQRPKTKAEKLSASTVTKLDLGASTTSGASKVSPLGQSTPKRPAAPKREVPVVPATLEESKTIKRDELQKKSSANIVLPKDTPKPMQDSLNTNQGEMIKLPLQSILQSVDPKHLTGRDPLVHVEGQQFSIRKEEALETLGKGVFSLTLKDLYGRVPKDVLAASAAESTEEVSLPLDQIMPLIPMEWFAVKNQSDSKIKAVEGMHDPFAGLGGNSADKEKSPSKPKDEKVSSEEELITPVMMEEDELLTPLVVEDEPTVIEPALVTPAIVAPKSLSQSSSLSLFDDDDEEPETPAPVKKDVPNLITPDVTAGMKGRTAVESQIFVKKPVRKQSVGDSLSLALSSLSEALPQDCFTESIDSIIHKHSNLQVEFNKDEILAALATGKVVLSLEELQSKASENLPFIADKKTEEINIPLGTILPLVPAEWLTHQGQSHSKIDVIEAMNDPFGSAFSESKTEEQKPSSPKPRPVNKEEDLITPVIAEEAEDLITPVIAEEAEELITPVIAEEEEELITPVIAEEEEELITPVIAEEEEELITPVIDEEEELISPLVFEDEEELITPVIAEEEELISPVIKEEQKTTSSPAVFEEEEKVEAPIIPKTDLARPVVVEEKATPPVPDVATVLESPKSSVKAPEVLTRPSKAPNGVDLNSCYLQDLLRIDGVDEKIAEAILAYREATGGFESINDLSKIKQIGPSLYHTLTGLRPMEELVSAERRINKIVKLSKNEDYSMAKLLEHVCEEYAFSGVVLSDKDGFEIASHGEVEEGETSLELLASAAPQAFKKINQFGHQSMMKESFLFTLYTDEGLVSFAHLGKFYLVFVHEEQIPSTPQMLMCKNFAHEMAWFCSVRAVV